MVHRDQVKGHIQEYEPNYAWTEIQSQLNPVLHEIWLVTLFVKRPSYLLIYLIFQQKVAKSSLSSFSNETPGYATLQPTSPSEDGGDYSKLELWISKNCINWT